MAETRRPARRLATLLAALLAIGAPAAAARAQVIVRGAAVGLDGEAQTAGRGFSLRKVDAPVLDALEDFQKHAAEGAWEKAFHAIGELSDADAAGMMPAGQGMMVPMQRRVWRLLADLPPDGRQAYRLFYDAKAQQMMESLAARDLAQQAELATLERLVDRYFITSVGDEAADRLADACFERGDFGQAERLWRMILEEYPDSELPELRLRVKQGLALARGRRWDELDDAVAAMRQRFPGRRVALGGAEVEPADYLASLAAGRGAAPAPEPAAVPEAALPEEGALAWQTVFFDEAMRASLEQQMRDFGYVRFNPWTRPPAADTDGRRLYVNWLGVVFAVDLHTGKLAWRTDKFTAPRDKAQMLAHRVDASAYTLVAAGGRVLSISLPLEMVSRGEMRYRLDCLDGDTGSTAWSSAGEPLKAWSFCGRPLVLDGTIYAAGMEADSPDMHLLALDLSSGELKWKVALGVPQTGADFMGGVAPPSPLMIHERGMLYVLTNNGALLAVSLPRRSLEWAFTFEPGQLQDPRMMMWNGVRQTPAGEGAAFLRDGVLYFKETGNNAIYALDLSRAELLWRRPASAADKLVGGDDLRLYLLSDSFSAIDRRSRALVWSSNLAVEAGDLRPIILRDHALVFGSRGVYRLSLANGDRVQLMRGADLGSSGGKLWLVGDRLVTLSNVAATAYDLPSAAPAEAVGQTPAAEGDAP